MTIWTGDARVKAAAAVVALSALAIGLAAQSGGAATGGPQRVLADHASPLATARRDRGPAHGRIDFAVALRWRHPEALARVDRAVSDPASPTYAHYLTPSEFRARFGPRPGAVARVKRFLRSRGLRVRAVSKGRMLVDATGSVAEAERAFRTELRRYQFAGHRLVEAADPVTIPASLSRFVLGVEGLNEVIARPLARKAPPPPVFLNAKPCSKYWAQHVATNQPKAYGQHQPWAPCGYTPTQIQSAYGISGPLGAGINGFGQTVVVIDAFASPTIRRDLQTYSSRHSLPAASLTQTVLPGPCHTACRRSDQQGWYGEETLDIEAVHITAPRATIHYVGARDAGKGLDEALAFVLDNRLGAVVSNSYGFIGESLGATAVEVGEQMNQQAVAEGIGLYFASGDAGDEHQPPPNGAGYVTPDYPASSPNVTAVGGTSLGIGPDASYRFETGWGVFRTDKKHGHWKPRPPGHFFYGSGGGTSRLFSQPSYQAGVVPPALASKYGGLGRVEPDIAVDGDPTTGILVGETQVFPNGKRKYAEARYGGTSLSTPLFAGLMALADQAAGFHHGFANPALYGLAGTGAFRDVLPASTPLAAVRRDFVNSVNRKKGYEVSLRSFNRDSSLRTTPGYDNVTGIGSPNGAAFINGLR
jgi:subtilase family serine protease